MTLVGNDASEILGDVSPIDGDYSLVALIRAIALKYGNYSVEDLAEHSTVGRFRARSRSDMENFLQSEYKRYALSVVECHNCIEESLTSNSNWRNEVVIKGKTFPVDKYLSQFGRTKIYINNRYRRIVAFVEKRATNIWVQALESTLCRLMPWYYPADLPEEERSFYQSIAVDNKSVTAEEKVDILVKYVNEIAEKINFREIGLRRKLDGIADRARQARMSFLRNGVQDYRRRIANLTRDLASNYELMDGLQLELTGLENASPETDDAMLKFFSTHKQVSLLSVSNSSLRFGIDDTLEFYDEDEFSRLLSNGRSFLHDFDETIRKALSAIFLEHKGVLRVNAVFDLLEFKLVNPKQDEYFIADSMPNPHIYFFGCSGGNGQYYAQYAESGDWDLGIEQAISATKNVNWGDSAVCSRMIGWLKHSTEPCIYVSDGLKPIEKVTEGMKRVSFQDFIRLIELTEGEENNG